MTRDQLRKAIKLIEPKHGDGYGVRVWFDGGFVDGDIRDPGETLVVVISRNQMPIAISIDAIDAIARIT